MPTIQRIPEPFRYSATHTKLGNAFKNDKTTPLSIRKASFAYYETLSRFNSRSKIHFDRYDLHIDGIVNPKPNVNYQKEIEARKNAPYLIGLEIEVEARTSIRSDEQEDDLGSVNPLSENRISSLANALNTYLTESTYVCTDGSLRDGCEIVTAPRTMQEVKQNFHNYWKFLRALRKAGYQSHDSGRCGLHMHISKQAMSTEKWNSLSRTLGRYKEFFKTLSRRDGNFQYCNFTGHNGRYMALNKSNESTNEFRFFRGTLKPESFLASIEIILSLVEHWRKTDKPTFAKWKKELEKYKYGYTYALPHFPNVQEVRRYTAEEREERKKAAQAKRLRKLAVLIDEIQRIKYDTVNYLGVLGVHSSQVGDKIVEINLPLSLSGFTAPIRKHLEKNPQCVTLKCVTSLASVLSEKHHIRVNGHTSWGRRCFYARLTSSY